MSKLQWLRVSPADGLDSASTPSANLALACFAEAIGTFMLVLVGTAVATAVVLGKGTAGLAYNAPRGGAVFRARPYPDRRFLGADQRCARQSGSHLGSCGRRQVLVAQSFPAYFAAQLVGAIVVALLVWAAYWHGAYFDAHLGASAPGNGASGLQVLLVECLIAFILVFTVIPTTTDDRVPPATAAVALGFALAAGVLLGGPVRRRRQPGACLGPMIVMGTFPVWLFYVLGPCSAVCSRHSPFRS